MQKWERLMSLVPAPPDFAIDWEGIGRTSLGDLWEKMAGTQQNPVWHGEGDVWRHTQMVCEALTRLPEFRALSERRRQEVFLAALLHDIGKISCTKWENGAWTSPNHAIVGAEMARERLQRDFGLDGTEEKERFRETVCLLVRYHMQPTRLLGEKNGRKRMRKIAESSRIAPDFSMQLLCILSEADVRGRIAEDVEQSAETVRRCAAAAAACGL